MIPFCIHLLEWDFEVLGWIILGMASMGAAIAYVVHDLRTDRRNHDRFTEIAVSLALLHERSTDHEKRLNRLEDDGNGSDDGDTGHPTTTSMVP